MQIRGFHSGNIDRLTARHAATEGSKQNVSRPSHEAQDNGQVHARSPELVRLSEELQQIPEIREDVVQRVSAKIAAGEYSTREAAEKTAEALLANQR